MGWIDTLLGTQTKSEERAAGDISISDPALAEYFGLVTGNSVEVTESSSLGVTAFYRSIALISGTIASLPLKSYRNLPRDAGREEIGTFLDNPAGPYPFTPYQWKELVMVHLLIHGETFLFHIYNNAGVLIGLLPVHPFAVSKVEWAGFDKQYTVSLDNGRSVVYDSSQMTHVMGLTTDTTRGVSPLTVFRRTIQLGIAGDLAGNRSMTNGMLIAGLVTPETDLEESEAQAIKDGINAKLSGAANAGDIAIVNRALKFTPWSMTNEDAQFLQSRSFQVEEFARMFGVPPHLLAAIDKQTSWGTGVAEQNLGLQKFTLMPWTSRVEEKLSTLLPVNRFCEFEYAGLLQGTPAQEIELLIKQVGAGLLTLDEARAIRNLPPLPKQPQQTEGGESDE